jgi:plasmid stabilization system protein ParE
MEPLADFSEAAREEFDEAFQWYAVRSHDAAVGFAKAVGIAIDQILAEPNRFARVFVDFQYCRVAKYPYSVMYRRTPRGIEIVAVAHAKRRPGY